MALATSAIAEPPSGYGYKRPSFGGSSHGSSSFGGGSGHGSSSFGGGHGFSSAGGSGFGGGYSSGGEKNLNLYQVKSI